MHNLYEEARHCFLLAEPEEKLNRSLEVVNAWRQGRLEWQQGAPAERLDTPGRLPRPPLVPPADVSKRGFGSTTRRAALIHALAHIELTAVNLAWDSIYRYRGMPRDYYQDWVLCAADESRHFFALRDRLRDMGFDYGDFNAHDELWSSAVKTADELGDRMAIVHRVFEARALDVVPPTREKFSAIGDRKTATILTEIANDEVGHVGAGTRWFRYRCQQQGLDPDRTFFALIEHYLGSPPRGPFNIPARQAAGFSDAELAELEARDRAFRAGRDQPTGR